MLEGSEPPIATAALPLPPERKKRGPWRNLLVAFIVFIVLGAATILVLHTLGLLRSEGTTDNQDIIKPE